MKDIDEVLELLETSKKNLNRKGLLPRQKDFVRGQITALRCVLELGDEKGFNDIFKTRAATK